MCSSSSSFKDGYSLLLPFFPFTFFLLFLLLPSLSFPSPPHHCSSFPPSPPSLYPSLFLTQFHITIHLPKHKQLPLFYLFFFPFFMYLCSISYFPPKCWFSLSFPKAFIIFLSSLFPFFIHPPFLLHPPILHLVIPSRLHLYSVFFPPSVLHLPFFPL